MLEYKKKFIKPVAIAFMSLAMVAPCSGYLATPLENKVSVIQTIEVDAASYSKGYYKVKAESGCNVRKKPGTKYTKLGSAAKGTKFKVTKVKGSWGYASIKCTNGTKKGWICLNYCSKVSSNKNNNDKPASKVRTYSKSKDGNKSLSKNFKVKEFACKDTKNNIDTILIDDQLVWYLQQIRNHYGKAVYINSAYRTSAYNSKVGGAKNSYHVKGMAADIRIDGVSPTELASYAKSIGVKGIGTYTTFVHIDTRTTPAFWKG